MKKGQIIEGTVQRVDFPNKGIVETADGVCVVKNALPGQKVRCAVNKVRKGKAEGRLMDVLEASPLECGSPCPHFGICGGCTYLSLPYEEQLKIKEAQVKKLLDAVLCKPICVKESTPEGNVSDENTYRFEGIKPSPVSFGYRNKMEFSFGDEVKDGPLALGMHKRGSFYDIVSVTECQIVDEDYRKILRCVRDYFANLQDRGMDIPFYHRLRHTGYLRHLLVRKAAKTGEILVALVTTTQVARWKTDSEVPGDNDTESQILEKLKQELLSLPLDGKIVGILHTINDSLADVVKSDETRLLYGQDYFYEELLGLKFKISQFSFFQTNSRGAEVLYETAREYIGGYIEAAEQKVTPHKPDKIVYDLYSGTGTIAQLMAPVAKKVIGVEIVEEAVEAAKKNAELNGLHNCEFVAGDVLKVLDDIEEKPDVIILDPPRDGIHPKALEKIIRYGVEHILYISCKPTSLARDLEVFLARGYQAERAVAVDQFPWTANVETVALLSKGEILSKKNKG
ncbi:MAG: 23S rRNA (uracil(1939)-C(5))-methyltransferase RlmD [Lachnospiraceae bacterium]|nr:23S rRNA (uracil(1939)-C(5))-methyltransferase RlmD [Lachnospiraceae bacterium]